MNLYLVVYCQNCKNHNVTQAKSSVKCKFCGKNILFYSRKSGTQNVKYASDNAMKSGEVCRELNKKRKIIKLLSFSLCIPAEPKLINLLLL